MKRLLPLALTLILALSGCTPAASSPSEAPSAAPTATPRPGPAVYTDYSQLTPYEKPQAVSKFTRRYAEFTDTLIPADDYGPLIPFPGAVVTRSAEYYGWGLEDYNLYGLMTLDGEVVVDPVFSSATVPSMWDERSDQARQLDCLILQKVVKGENGEPIDVAAVCARDGSWCTGFDYSYDWEMLMDRTEENIIPLRRRDPSQSLFYRDLVFLDVHTGEEVKSIDLSGVLERWPDVAWSLIYNLRYGERYAIFSDDVSHYLFDSETGEVQVLEELLNLLSGELEAPYGAPFYEGLCAVKTASGWGYIDGNGWVTDPIYEESWPFENGVALVRDEQAGGWYTYIDHSGRVIHAFPENANNVWQSRELWTYQLQGETHWLTADFQEIALPADFLEYARWKYESSYVGGGWFSQNITPSATQWDGIAFWNYETGARWDFLGYNLSSMENGLAILRRLGGEHFFALADLNTGELTELGEWSSVYFSSDSLTGEPYLQLSGLDGGESEWRRLDGSILYRSDTAWGWRASLWGDRALLAADDAVTLTKLGTGELIFSWPLHSAEE